MNNTRVVHQLSAFETSAEIFSSLLNAWIEYFEYLQQKKGEPPKHDCIFLIHIWYIICNKGIYKIFKGYQQKRIAPINLYVFFDIRLLARLPRIMPRVCVTLNSKQQNEHWADFLLAFDNYCGVSARQPFYFL